MSINRTIIVGRITKSPELKSTQSNISFVNFTLAVNRPFTSQNGEQEVDFIQCIAWRKQAENMAQYLHKGSLISVEGRIQTRTYEADNSTRYITEVVCDSVQFLESKSERQEEKQDEFETPKQNDEDDMPF